MELAEALEKLRNVQQTVPVDAWDDPLTRAVQRGLAQLYLLNPDDDIDGDAGKRTRAAWRLFHEACNAPGAPDHLGPANAAALAAAAANREGIIGSAKVALQPPIPFRRNASKANGDASIAALIEAARASGFDKPQTAYVLATAEHESDAFKTLEEYSSGKQYEGRKDLGNTQAGDGVRFKGRGYVQLTGRRNYVAYAQGTGIRIDRLPFIPMNWAALSVYVIVDGMKHGAYTGRKLGDFVGGGKQDFLHARQVINGMDRADKIAAQAEAWLKQL